MKDIFASAEYGIAGLLIFVALFSCVVIWAFRPGMKKRLDDYGNIPLKDDTL